MSLSSTSIERKKTDHETIDYWETEEYDDSRYYAKQYQQQQQQRYHDYDDKDSESIELNNPLLSTATAQQEENSKQYSEKANTTNYTNSNTNSNNRLNSRFASHHQPITISQPFDLQEITSSKARNDLLSYTINNNTKLRRIKKPYSVSTSSSSLSSSSSLFWWRKNTNSTKYTPIYNNGPQQHYNHDYNTPENHEMASNTTNTDNNDTTERLKGKYTNPSSLSSSPTSLQFIINSMRLCYYRYYYNQKTIVLFLFLLFLLYTFGNTLLWILKNAYMSDLDPFDYSEGKGGGRYIDLYHYKGVIETLNVVRPKSPKDWCLVLPSAPSSSSECVCRNPLLPLPGDSEGRNNSKNDEYLKLNPSYASSIQHHTITNHDYDTIDSSSILSNYVDDDDNYDKNNHDNDGTKPTASTHTTNTYQDSSLSTTNHNNINNTTNHDWWNDAFQYNLKLIQNVTTLYTSTESKILDDDKSQMDSNLSKDSGKEEMQQEQENQSSNNHGSNHLLDILFLGDGMIERLNGRYEGRDVEELQKNQLVFDDLFGRNSDIHGVALGIAHDRTSNLLWRIQNGELPTSLNPQVIWILIGSDDIAHYQCSTDIVSTGIKRIVEELLLRIHPDSFIVVNSILPRTPWEDGRLVSNESSNNGKGRLLRYPFLRQEGKNSRETKVYQYQYNDIRDGRSLSSHNEFNYWPYIQEINDNIREFTYKHDRVAFYDCSDLFLAQLGNAHFQRDEKFLMKELMNDFIHPSDTGYRIWGEHVVKFVKSLQNGDR